MHHFVEPSTFIFVCKRECQKFCALRRRFSSWICIGQTCQFKFGYFIHHGAVLLNFQGSRVEFKIRIKFRSHWFYKFSKLFHDILTLHKTFYLKPKSVTTKFAKGILAGDRNRNCFYSSGQFRVDGVRNGNLFDLLCAYKIKCKLFDTMCFTTVARRGFLIQPRWT